MEQVKTIIHYLPILSTIISALFSVIILRRYSKKRTSKQLLWWGIGIAVYGLGTLIEGLNTLYGWNVVFFKLWYISGALLGGAPLAIGTIYLLIGEKAGRWSVRILFSVVAVTSAFVLLSPVDLSLVGDGVLNSRVLVWQSIRKVSPFINSLAALFLIGGAFYSAHIYSYRRETRNRFLGNLSIAIGAILPGIGGFYSRIGVTEVLYAGEFFGIILIWVGYQLCSKPLDEPVGEVSFE